MHAWKWAGRAVVIPAAIAVLAATAFASHRPDQLVPDGDGWNFTGWAVTGPTGETQSGTTGTAPSGSAAGDDKSIWTSDGWTDANDERCQLLKNVSVPPATQLEPVTDFVCETSNEWRAAGMQPSGGATGDTGAIWTEFDAIVNAAGVIFDGSGSWLSPPFCIAVTSGPGCPAGVTTVTIDHAIGGITLRHDRGLKVPPIEAGTEGTTRVVLHNAAALTSGEQIYFEEFGARKDDSLLSEDAPDWRRVSSTLLRPSTLAAGTTYRLRYITSLTTEDAEALGSDELPERSSSVDGLRRVFNGAAVGYDNILLTVSQPEEGATGPSGTDGINGTNGTNGTDGKDGAAGPPGSAGAAGAQGPAGQPGAPGPVGPQGLPGREGSPGRPVSINSPEARRLLRIDRLQPFMTRGRFKNQLRTRIFCKAGADERCEGTMKVRTIRRVNIAFQKGNRLMRRVTLCTNSYRLNINQIGYAKCRASRLERKIIRRRGPFRAEVLVTVLDEEGRQQTLRRVFKLRASSGRR